MRPFSLPGGGLACRRAVHLFCQNCAAEGIEEKLRGGVLLGLSGGPDSVLLFHLLRQAAHQEGFPFGALHLHHGIRGAEGDRDAAFCRALCDQYDVPCEEVRGDVPALCRAQKVSLETGARTWRYAQFEAALDRHPEYACCATAHHATDQLETVLFRLLRGSGMRGLCGIPPVRGVYVRPLLRLTRQDILSALEEMGATYVTDSSNASEAYTRNYIRAQILPRLAEIQPEPERAVARFSHNLREEEEAAVYAAQEAYRRLLVQGENGPRALDAAGLRAIPRAMGRRVLEQLYAAGGHTQMLEQTHLHQIWQMLASGQAEGSVAVPGGQICRLAEGRVFFSPPVGEKGVTYEVLLHPGENCLPGGQSLWVLPARDPEFEKQRANIYNLFIHTTLKSVTISNMSARNYRQCDAYRFGGMTHRVRRMMTDRKLPHSLRAVLPMVCCAGEIVWVPGFSMADAQKDVAPGKDSVCLYYCYKGEGH